MSYFQTQKCVTRQLENDNNLPPKPTATILLRGRKIDNEDHDY